MMNDETELSLKVTADFQLTQVALTADDPNLSLGSQYPYKV